ncbi:hypothetical protein [Flavobacterium urocaniciphilum]|uniref:hypothetical protein n=1 Tax=Flavobacterium urocaniciphilum TaxID=1299341 RepID=UPI00115FCFF4|nr:hypothetical protein [Flavobacterium urocaniciphilum]
MILLDSKPENFGVVGDALGGILNPIIAIASALLTFLAFYIQKLANDDLKKQFYQQKADEKSDFIFSNYKERIHLIINEINNFNISFHNGTLISSAELLNSPNAKKYNFIGIQAINLFLVEFYKLLESKKKEGNLEFKFNDSYHAINLHIQNLISAFYNVHVSIQKCDLKKEYIDELKELLEYTYYSKLNYFSAIISNKNKSSKTKTQIDYLYDFYNKKN